MGPWALMDLMEMTSSYIIIFIGQVLRYQGLQWARLASVDLVEMIYSYVIIFVDLVLSSLRA